jgi:cell pole-organizing protein PopZ
MSNAAKAQQEPTMEEILASIRRIISDDTQQPAEAAPKAKAKPAEPAAAPAPKVVAVAPPPAAEAEEEDGLNQDDIDAVFAAMESDTAEPEAAADDVLELTSDMSEWDEALAESEAGAEATDEAAEVPEIIEPSGVVFDEAPEPEDEPVSAPAPAPRAEMPKAAPLPPLDRPASPPSPFTTESLLSPATDAVVSSAFGSLSRTLLNQNPRTVEDLVGDMLRPMLKDWLDANLPTLVERMVRAEIERMSRGH